MMTDNADKARKCEKCSAPLAPDAPEGLCPRCLMALNLATQTEAPGAEAGPGGAQAAPPKPEPPPAIEEIAPHFPQLELLECLGRGGMGVVYKARQPRLGRFVALKVLAREKEKEPRFAERFTREAQALARLNHPNIVTVYDFGEADGLYYLLMEYVDGMNLRQLLQTRKLAAEEALVIVPSICEALQYAHQQGIVHRDIKPENILMDKQGRVKIADFGIAKLLGAEGAATALTGEQQVMGTPHYMAPEQMEKPDLVDHRADIFSLGVVFYEMLTGELPLGKFAPPSMKVHVDVRLDEVVLHALEKEPARRYQQAGQVKTDLETIARTEGGAAHVGAAPGHITPPPALSPAENAWRQVRGPGIGLVVTAVLNWICIPIVLLIALAFVRTSGTKLLLPTLVLPLAVLVLSAIIMAAGLQMKRLQAYWLAVIGAILAILVTPGNLVGLPIGIWALVVLSQRQVREAFGTGQPMPPFGLAPAPSGGGGWKIAAVITAGVMLLLAIPIGGIMLSIAIPNFLRARQRAQAVQNQTPRFLVRGTVTDAATGQPIAGARVDDNYYGAGPNRSPQQAWTDAQGRYQLLTWPEEHTLAASAPAYQTKLATLVRTGASVTTSMEQMDFQLQPAENPTAPAVRMDPKAFNDTVTRGSEAWRAGDYSKALALLLPAAQNGHPIAQHRLGVMYTLGQGVVENMDEAVRWYRKAADQGQGESQYSLGMRYVLGQGVNQDFQEAVHWFKLAADQGVGVAQYALGLRYTKGEGVPEDLVEAYKWASLANHSGPYNTQVQLGHLEEKMTSEQLAQAKRLVKEFVPHRTGPADF
jgi:TPR repeat protein/tRNA A-37 threonylcarbamoyl transferase component Bud32